MGPAEVDGVQGSLEGDDRAAARRVWESNDADWRIALANVAGAVVVSVYQSLLSYGGDEPDRYRADTLVSVVVLAVYGGAALLTTRAVARAIGRRYNRWLFEGRLPTAEERDGTLAYPSVVARLVVAVWWAAAPMYGLLNWIAFDNTGVYSIQVTTSILLGGLMTAGICYLLVERLSRPAFAAVLAAGPTTSLTVGVTRRFGVVWLLGSAVPLVVIGAAPLGLSEDQRSRLTVPIAFLVVAGLVGGFVVTRGSARSVADPLDRLREGLARVRAGELDVAVRVEDGGELGLVQAGFNEMVSGLRERRQLEDLFGRHVGIEVARAAVTGGTKLGGERCEASVLFVDLVGSTEMAQRLEPEAVVAALNSVFAVVARVVTAEGGWINKFEGDAALCVFGPPAGQGDHAAAALRAAVALRAGLVALGADGPHALDAGIGVASGLVVAGNVGDEQRYEYTVIGDPVNEAARLTELAKAAPGRVLASGAVVAAAGADGAAWSLVERRVLRGRAGETAVHAPAG